jgi:hypothetical protein
LVLARARLAKLVAPVGGVGVIPTGLVGVASLPKGDLVCVEVCGEAELSGGDAHPATTGQSKASKDEVKKIRRMAGVLDAETG